MTETNFNRQMPHSIESELALLGSIMLRTDAIDDVSFLQAGDFYKSAHRKIFEGMRAIYRKNEPVDNVTLTAWLENNEALEQVGGIEFLSEITNNVPTSHNIKSYATIIKEKSNLRNLNEILWQGMELIHSNLPFAEILEELEAKLFKAGQGQLSDSITKIDDIIIESMSHLDQFEEGVGSFTGVSTGFEDLDLLTNGLQKGELTVIAARPSMGKTALALDIATNAALNDNLPVAIFSMEMGATAIGIRMICSESGVNIQLLRNGDAAEGDYKALTKAAAKLSECQIFIDDSGLISTGEILSRCRRLKSKHNIGLVVVDYLQLLKARRGIENREQQISDMSRSLKQIARDLNLPVVCLSQLNRGVEGRDNKRPRLSDIRESGAVEQDADMIAFIYRDDYYNDNSEFPGIAEVNLAKNRNGPTGKVELHFNIGVARFGNLDKFRDNEH